MSRSEQVLALLREGLARDDDEIALRLVMKPPPREPGVPPSPKEGRIRRELGPDTKFRQLARHP